MEALVYHGPGKRAWESVPDPDAPGPDRRDRPDRRGDDLRHRPAHPQGRRARGEPGTILGHEAVGTIEEVGSAVTSFVPGDRVLLSCITACGRCRFCKEAHYGLCTGGGGWILGHLIDGVQAEYARIPFVDTSAYKVPEGLTDEQVLFLADILPTSYEVGILNGRVKPGDVVAIVGAGPIGLAAVLTAKLYTPATIVVIDLADEAARAREELRRRRDDRQRRRRPGCSDHGADRRPRRRRGDRGGRRAVDVRALHGDRAAGRHRREHRRARRAGDAPSGEALDQRTSR